MIAQEVAPGIHRIHDRFVNWYLVEGDGGLAAIDAGLPPDWDALGTALGELGHTRADLRAVVLTHAHVDHIGFAERARKELGIPVYAHSKDADLGRHPLRMAKSEKSPLRYARNASTRRALKTMLETGAFRAKPIRELVHFEDGETLSAVPGTPIVVFTPGHTFGHAALHLPDRDVLFTGDALVTRNPYTGGYGPQIVSRAATADSAQALRSLDRIAETGAGTLLPGHGERWTAGAAEAAHRARAVGVT